MRINMLSKALGMAALLAAPFSASLWWASHHAPQHRRYTVSDHKSLRVMFMSGVCNLRLLDMPKPNILRSRFASVLKTPAMFPSGHLSFQSFRDGVYRITTVTFPLWLSTVAFVSTGMGLLLTSPTIRWVRILRGWCSDCGYDLRGTRRGRCPECGHVGLVRRR